MEENPDVRGENVNLENRRLSIRGRLCWVRLLLLGKRNWAPTAVTTEIAVQPPKDHLPSKTNVLPNSPPKKRNVVHVTDLRIKVHLLKCPVDSPRRQPITKRNAVNDARSYVVASVVLLLKLPIVDLPRLRRIMRRNARFGIWNVILG
jgi:hypothetical protein